MRGLDPDEREALENAGAFIMPTPLVIKMMRRGLITSGEKVETRNDDAYKWHRVTPTGWLALKLDRLARGSI